MPIAQDLNTARTILVAGGSGVIGRGISQHFGAEHWHVAVHYHRNQTAATEVAKVIRRSGGTATVYQANVRELPQIRVLVESLVKTHGHLDVLIWAVGIAKSDLLVRTSSRSWSDLLSTNLTGCFHTLNAVAPIFQKQQYGSVVLIGSLSGLRGATGQAAYAASKAGLLGLMKSVAKEWAPWNIRVNVIFPGWQRSPLSGDAFPKETDRQDEVLGLSPTTHDVARAVYGLALSRATSGQIWNLDSRIW